MHLMERISNEYLACASGDNESIFSQYTSIIILQGRKLERRLVENSYRHRLSPDAKREIQYQFTRILK